VRDAADQYFAEQDDAAKWLEDCTERKPRVFTPAMPCSFLAKVVRRAGAGNALIDAHDAHRINAVSAIRHEQRTNQDITATQHERPVGAGGAGTQWRAPRQSSIT
jgi:hypothetical protein